AQRRMGIRTVLAPLTEAAATVELAGRVGMDPNAGGRVQPTHGGRIEPGPKGLPVPGQTARQGEILAYVRHHSDPFTRALQQSQLAELEAAEHIAADRLRRLESLEGSVAGKDLDAARAEATGYRGRVQAIRASLDARQPLLAPITGVIASAQAVSGQVVEERDVLFEIVDPGAWVVDATTADVSIAARIGPARVLGVPGLELELVGAGRSLRDGVLPLTFRTRPNDAGQPPPLAIGQSVTVIATLTEKSQGMRLPASSIVRSAVNEPVVWIKTGAERYLPQPIQYRPLDTETVLVTKGLGPDNRVVVEGASLIAQIR
ncbi:MAG: efflux RND transporter periplasmic adaptor subunit, partial [Gammaproteobacteria bacterium]